MKSLFGYLLTIGRSLFLLVQTFSDAFGYFVRPPSFFGLLTTFALHHWQKNWGGGWTQ